MEHENVNPQRSGISLFTTVQVVFLILKLAGLVSWSWAWVLSPLWIEVTLWVLAHAILATLRAAKEGGK